MFHSQDIQVFTFLTIPHDLPNPCFHDEYQYIRQGTFFDISLTSHETWPIDRYKQGQ